jgi:hypothetical protein
MIRPVLADLQVLQKLFLSFNFGPFICKWFKTLYAESKSCVINNGHMSNFFNLERGSRQKDPLSPYVFIIGVELLSFDHSVVCFSSTY